MSADEGALARRRSIEIAQLEVDLSSIQSDVDEDKYLFPVNNERFLRWADRARAVLAELFGPQEAERLDGLHPYVVATNDDLREEMQTYQAFLSALREDVKGYPGRYPSATGGRRRWRA